MEELGAAAGLQRADARGPAGCFWSPGRPARARRTSLASMINYHQRELRPPHHHDRRPDRVLPLRTRSRRSISARSASTCRASAEAIRRALRQDPDVILVGEMRDLETIEAAITAAETGHIVFGTLHTTGAQGTVNRIIDVFPDQPAGADPHAAFHRRSSASCRRRCCRRSAAAASPPTRCWSSTPAIANLIRENKTFRITSAIQTGAQARHACCSTTTCSSCGRTGTDHEGRRPRQSATTPDELAAADSPTPNAACSTTNRTKQRRKTRRNDG